jgi:hypothetical protein
MGAQAWAAMGTSSGFTGTLILAYNSHRIINHMNVASILVILCVLTCGMLSLRCCFSRQWRCAVLLILPVLFAIGAVVTEHLRMHAINDARNNAIERGDIPKE